MPKIIEPSTIAAAASLFMAVFAWPGSAHAATVRNWCAGEPSGLDTGSLHQLVNTCSVQGDARDAVDKAAMQWNWFSLPLVTSHWTRPPSDCIIVSNDWKHDWALVNPDQIDGLNGQTRYWHVNWCVNPPGPFGDYSEADVRLASDLNFALRAPSDTYWGNPDEIGTGRGTTAHEMGHQLGLDHFYAFSTLNTDVGRPGSPVYGPGPMPVDIFSTDRIYGNSNVVDVQTNGGRSLNPSIGSNRIVPNHEFDEFVCRNSSLPLFVTVTSTGRLQPIHDQRIYLASTVGGAPVLEWHFDRTVAFAGIETTHSWVLNIPSSAPVGDFYLYHEVNRTNSLTGELLSGNNLLKYTGRIRIRDCGGFMIKSDTNLGLALKGGPDGTNLTLSNACGTGNTDCKWQYKDGMLVSDRNPALAINAWGGAVFGTTLRVVTGCTAANPDCTWTYNRGQFLSDRNRALAINAWGGAANNVVMRLHNACNPNLNDCTFTAAGVMLSSAPNPMLHWNAYGGAALGNPIKLMSACEGNNPDCTWTFKKGMILSDRNQAFAVNAFGGAANGTDLKLHNACTATNLDCTWSWTRGVLTSDRNAALAVAGEQGETDGSQVGLSNTICQSQATKCDLNGRVMR
jgi:hypothetical protein